MTGCAFRYDRIVDHALALRNQVHKLGLVCFGRADRPKEASQQTAGKSASVWLVMARTPEDLGELSHHPAWRPIGPDPRMRVWTDDFSDVLSVFCWW